MAALGVGCLVLDPAFAQAPPPPELCRAYYLEHQARDYAAARQLYQQVIQSRAAEQLKAVARTGEARCRDHLAARDFASLMPPDALAYLELTRPFEILEKLATMVGLTGKDVREVLAQRPSVESNAPFYVPREVIISPAIFEALGSFGGAAFALTNINPTHETPLSGVLVIHHGDVLMLKGLLETAFQFSPTTERIQDLPTFGLQAPNIGKLSGVLTESLLIVGTSRELVDGVVGRLLGKIDASLGSREDLREVAAHRKGATLFVFVDIQRSLEIARTHMDEEDRREFSVANALADLDSFRWATYSAGIQDGAIGARLTLRLADDHHSLVYNMMRLPPMSRRCLGLVPAEAAGLLGMGLNPAWAQAAMDTAKSSRPDLAVTGFDIGREFFGNIQEVCLFALPGRMAAGEKGDGPSRIPNAGVILAVNDTARSKALWGQLLSIPGLVSGDAPQPPKELKIGDTQVTAYEIPKFGRIYLAETRGCIALAATRPALKAVLRTGEKGRSIVEDEVMGRAFNRMPRDSSMMVAVHVGRAIATAAQNADRGMAMVAGPAGELCDETIAWVAVGQSPNQLTLQWQASGLPNVNEALKKFGPMINMFSGMQAPSKQEPGKKPDKIVKSARKQPRRGEEL